MTSPGSRVRPNVPALRLNQCVRHSSGPQALAEQPGSARVTPRVAAVSPPRQMTPRTQIVGRMVQAGYGNAMCGLGTWTPQNRTPRVQVAPGGVAPGQAGEDPLVHQVADSALDRVTTLLAHIEQHISDNRTASEGDAMLNSARFSHELESALNSARVAAQEAPLVSARTRVEVEELRKTNESLQMSLSLEQQRRRRLEDQLRSVPEHPRGRPPQLLPRSPTKMVASRIVVSRSAVFMPSPMPRSPVVHARHVSPPPTSAMSPVPVSQHRSIVARPIRAPSSPMSPSAPAPPRFAPGVTSPASTRKRAVCV